MLKKFIYFFIKSRTWKADIAKLILAFNYFWKHSIVDVWQVFGCARVLNEYLRVSNTPGFWICQDSEYTRVLNMSALHRVLNMNEYVWIIPEYTWLDLNMSEYVRICKNMCVFIQICLKGFCFTFPHRNPLSKGTIGCFFWAATETIWFVFLFLF